jgi:hypothetical protein
MNTESSLGTTPRINFQCTIGLQNLPVPYWLLVTGLGLLALLEQIVERSLFDPGFENLSRQTVVYMLAVPSVFVYILIAMRMLKTNTIEELEQLRPALKITDDEFGQHLRRMVCIDRRVEVMLFVASVIVVLIPLLLLHTPTPMSGGKAYLPENLGVATFIVLIYSVLGWLLLLLLYSSVTLSKGLWRLAQRPLVINVFDPTLLLPFGRISLDHSLTLAGLVLVLVIPLGAPEQLFDYLVITLLSLGSLLTLVLPLRGVRLQVTRAKLAVLAELASQFYAIQTTLLNNPQLEDEELKKLSTRSSELQQLRSLVLAGPSWPFRSASSTIRAALVAVSPLIYFLINELVRSALVPLLIK